MPVRTDEIDQSLRQQRPAWAKTGRYPAHISWSRPFDILLASSNREKSTRIYCVSFSVRHWPDRIQ